jgi:hypothetical protein
MRFQEQVSGGRAGGQGPRSKDVDTDVELRDANQADRVGVPSLGQPRIAEEPIWIDNHLDTSANWSETAKSREHRLPSPQGGRGARG